MRFLKFNNTRWNVRITTHATGMSIPVVDGYVSIDNLMSIEAVQREGLEKILIALKKKYHLSEVDESTVPDEVKEKMGIYTKPQVKKEKVVLKNVKECKGCGRIFSYSHHFEKYCDECKEKRKK